MFAVAAGCYSASLKSLSVGAVASGLENVPRAYPRRSINIYVSNCMLSLDRRSRSGTALGPHSFLALELDCLGILCTALSAWNRLSSSIILSYSSYLVDVDTLAQALSFCELLPFTLTSCDPVSAPLEQAGALIPLQSGDDPAKRSRI